MKFPEMTEKQLQQQIDIREEQIFFNERSGESWRKNKQLREEQNLYKEELTKRKESK